MAHARVFLPPNPLEAALGGPEDPIGASLELRAAELVRALGPGLRILVAEQIAIVERIAAASEDVLFAESHALGDAALAICEVAGPAGLGPLGEGARGIVAMVDALINQGVWHTEALRLHIAALAMFSANPGLPPREAARVLADLQGLRDGIGVLD